jgi:hypothetical protein
MDVTPLLFGKHSWGWDERSKVSIVFGANMLLLAWWIDRQTVQVRNTQGHPRAELTPPQDFSFWLYLFGGLAFTGGMLAHTPSKVSAAFVTRSGFVEVVTCSASPEITQGFVVHLVARPLSMREVRGSKPCESNFFFYIFCFSLPVCTCSTSRYP